MIRLLEQAILARLKQKLSDVAIEPYPDKPSEYVLIHPNAAVLVRYVSSDYQNPLSPDIIAQDREINFELAIIARSLTDNRGVYELLEDIRQALMGWRIEGFEKFYYTRDEFVAENDGIWQYAIYIATSRRVYENQMEVSIINYDEESGELKDDFNVPD